jgi:hypothetical protein
MPDLTIGKVARGSLERQKQKEKQMGRIEKVDG